MTVEQVEKYAAWHRRLRVELRGEHGQCVKQWMADRSRAVACRAALRRPQTMGRITCSAVKPYASSLAPARDGGSRAARPDADGGISYAAGRS